MKTKIGKLNIETHDDYLGKILRGNKFYEESYLKFSLTQLKQDGGFILDIGANIGNHTLFWLYKGFYVNSFEPIRKNYRLLHCNVFGNSLGDNSELYKFGFGEKEETIKLQVFAHNMGACRRGEGGEDVTIHLLDNYNFGKIQLIKIDVEGMEGKVIRGGLETIKKYKPDLMVEINKQETRDLIESLGYKKIFGKGNNKTIYFKFQ
ncbi:MAG: FkbM family methyltransferase [Candidatus Gracilibacteria bacterium]|nr:FkbM family methyltransferase [Candidatus Gracilibacteria bacterium]